MNDTITFGDIIQLCSGVIWGRGGLIMSGWWRVAGLAGQNLQAEKRFTFASFCALHWKHQRSYERKKHA